MSTSQAPAVEIVDLTKTYGHGPTAVHAVRHLNLVIPRGEFVALMGPSGSGKSSLLHLLAGLAPPTSGEVSIEGAKLSSLDDDALTILRRRSIGFVFQAFQLIDVLTAVENVALPLVLDGVAERDANERALALLDRVGLRERATHLPSELSGGEKQRVAIARALIHEPVLLLADEPTGNLDSESGEQVLRLLRELVRERDHSVVMVTHDSSAAGLADRLVKIRDGRIEEEQRFHHASEARES